MATISGVAETGVPTIVALNLGSTLAVLPRELFDPMKTALMVFDVLDTRFWTSCSAASNR